MENYNQLDIKALLRKALKYWYLYVIIFPTFLGLAYMYLKNAQPKYEAEAMLLIKGDEKSGELIEEAIFDELKLLKKKNLVDEILTLRSTPVMEKVVEQMQLQYQYYSLERFRKHELVYNSPIQIVDWHPENEEVGVYAEIFFDDNGSYQMVTIDSDDNEVEYNGTFGKEIELKEGKLTLAQNNFEEGQGPVAIQISSVAGRAGELIDGLGVAPMGEKSSTLLISLKDVSRKRGEELLVNIIDAYNAKTREDKNKVYENSIGLISERINLITQELQAAERNVANYKSRFSMMAYSVEGNMLMNELNAYNKEISNRSVQLEILNGIESFLVQHRSDFNFVPTNNNITNLTLTNQLSSFNDFIKQRINESALKGPDHTDIKLIDRQIQNLRQTIIDNIRTIKGDLQLTRDANKDLRANLETRLNSLPTRERELVEIERQKGIKEELYLYLLQKREESAISLSVTVANGKIIEPPASRGPVSPKKAQIALIAFFMGFAIPTGMILLLESMNDKVEMEEEIEELAGVPVVGSLGTSSRKNKVVVTENSQSPIAEMFRLLRVNLAYVAPGKTLKTLMVTSSASGDGKSFITANLGMAQALTGKRVLLVELDLRKPKQSIYFETDPSRPGIVNYLVDPAISADEIINNSGLHENLDIITCGPKPPNPSELILSERLRVFVDQMRDVYDFIILDAPPVGLVADALQMKDLVEACMYVVRSGVTKRGQLDIIRDIAQKDKLPKPFVVLNGVSLNRGGGYGYGYGYGYGESKQSKKERKGKSKRQKKAKA